MRGQELVRPFSLCRGPAGEQSAESRGTLHSACGPVTLLALIGSSPSSTFEIGSGGEERKEGSCY